MLVIGPRKGYKKTTGNVLGCPTLVEIREVFSYTIRDANPTRD